jgi:hypothetical protein
MLRFRTAGAVRLTQHHVLDGMEEQGASQQECPIPANDTIRWTGPIAHRSLATILIRATPKMPMASSRADRSRLVDHLVNQ